MSRSWRGAADRFLQALTADSRAFAFLISFLFLCLLYRIRLYTSLTHGLHAADRPDHALLAFSVWRGCYSDLLCGLCGAGLWLFFGNLPARPPQRLAGPSWPYELLYAVASMAFIGAMAAEVFLITEQGNLTLLMLPVGAAGLDWHRARRNRAGSRFRSFLTSLLMSTSLAVVVLAGVVWFAGEIWRGKFIYHVWLPFRYALLVWLGYGIWRGIIWSRAQPDMASWGNQLLRRWAGLAIGAVLVFGCAMSMFAHYHVWLELESGLRLTLIGSSWGQFGVGDFARFIPRESYFFLGAPLAVFFLVVAWPGWLRRHARRGLLAIGCVALALLVVLWNRPAKAETTLNPLHYLALDCVDESLRWLHPGSAYASRKDLPLPAQMRSLKPIDPAFVHETALAPELSSPTNSRPWNIVLLVFESTGAEYAFDASVTGEPPMPFLRQLCDNGVWLQNHYTTANSSSEAYYAIFTGNYPCPGGWNGTVTDNHAPAINKLLGSRYHSFLVHPSSRTYAFPHSVLENSGLENLFDRRKIPPGGEPDKDVAARNENHAVGYFLDKLDHTPQPFLAMYASFVPHYPYPDYGPEYRFIPYPKTERQYYYNNLRLLDTQLRRIYTHLESKGLLENTVIMVAGDHGEAFGQHPGVWKHSFGTYDEMFRPPALFYQPKLFPAKAIRKLTSHTDLVPTLLDAVGVPFNEKLIQGESLYRPSDRKYVFTLTRNDGCYTAVGVDGIKLSVSFKQDASFAYDLGRDPHETVKLPVDRFPAQLDALLKFHNYQLSVFPAYNHSIRMKQPFHGEAHPKEAPNVLGVPPAGGLEPRKRGTPN